MMKTKICQYCKMEVPEDATVCGHCGRWISPLQNGDRNYRPDSRSVCSLLDLPLVIWRAQASAAGPYVEESIAPIGGKKEKPQRATKSVLRHTAPFSRQTALTPDHGRTDSQHADDFLHNRPV